jgi:hypothetical protein
MIKGHLLCTTWNQKRDKGDLVCATGGQTVIGEHLLSTAEA